MEDARSLLNDLGCERLMEYWSDGVMVCEKSYR
jgi:hypothetical protein